MIQKARMTAKPSRFLYYAASLPTLLFGVRPSSLVRAAAMVLGWRGLRLVRLQRPGPAFFVRNVMDVWTIKEICLDRDYERVGAPIQDGWTVVDVGAGIGEFAVDTAVRHPSAVVHALEPSPGSYALLCRNVQLNGAGNVRPYEVAVTGDTGATRLDVSSDDGASHHVVADLVPAGTVEVAARTLRAVLDDLQISKCDFLKIDCEGGEYALLLAADRVTLGRVSRICLEYHDGPWGTHGQLVDHLTAAGFRTVLTENRAYRELGFLYAWRPRG